MHTFMPYGMQLCIASLICVAVIAGASLLVYWHVTAGHYILQMQHIWDRTLPQPLLKTREMSEAQKQLGPPLFRLAGLAIGNGLTDPALQVVSADCVSDCHACLAFGILTLAE